MTILTYKVNDKEFTQYEEAKKYSIQNKFKLEKVFTFMSNDSYDFIKNYRKRY